HRRKPCWVKHLYLSNRFYFRFILRQNCHAAGRVTSTAEIKKMYFRRKFVRAMTSTSRSPLNRAFLYLSAFAFVIANVASAQVSMVPGTYSQNFDSLSSSASSPWNNNVTIAGWYSSKSSTDTTTYIGSTGTG